MGLQTLRYGNASSASGTQTFGGPRSWRTAAVTNQIPRTRRNRNRKNRKRRRSNGLHGPENAPPESTSISGRGVFVFTSRLPMGQLQSIAPPLRRRYGRVPASREAGQRAYGSFTRPDRGIANGPTSRMERIVGGSARQGMGSRRGLGGRTSSMDQQAGISAGDCGKSRNWEDVASCRSAIRLSNGFERCQSGQESFLPVVIEHCPVS